MPIILCSVSLAECCLSVLMFLVTSANVVMFLPVFVCLSVCIQDNSKSYGRIFLKFWGNVGHGINYQWFNFGRDPTGILDSGSLWNFRYHCIKGGMREKQWQSEDGDATWRIALPWWRYLRATTAFLVLKILSRSFSPTHTYACGQYG